MAPTKSSKIVKRTQTKDAKPTKSLNTKRKAYFARYIRKLVKSQHRGFSVSPKAMPIINAFVNDIFEKVAAEASKLSDFHGNSDVTVKEIRAAVKVLLPGDVSKHLGLGKTDAITDEE